MDENEKKKCLEREEAKRKRGAMFDRLHYAGAPARAMKAWREGLRETEALSAVRNWLKGDACFLLLSGGVGCGKTLATLEAVAHLGGAFMSAVDVSRLGLYGDEAADASRRMERVPLLVLDDMGTEYLTDVWSVQLDGVINARYNNGKRTVLTTNLTPELFRERYGTRVADRIRHDGTVFRCGSTSMRRQQTPTPAAPGDTDAD